MELNEKVISKISPYLYETNSCIEYPVLNKDGYGSFQMMFEGKKLHFKMHRVSAQLSFGITLNHNDIVCHRCDNPKCVNPRHLFIGSHKDNNIDKVSKGRQAIGNRNGRWIDGRSLNRQKIERIRKFKDNQVALIRRSKACGLSINNISSIYGFPVSSVKDICCGRTYPDIKIYLVPVKI